MLFLVDPLNLSDRPFVGDERERLLLRIVFPLFKCLTYIIYLINFGALKLLVF